MTMVDSQASDDRVSRQRYLRERKAREQAEKLLEDKSRELYDAYQELKAQAQGLETTVRSRTSDLEDAKSRAEDANDAKSAFLAMISHEIRTPLNGILGMSTALQEAGLDDTSADMVGVIQSSADALLDLLNDLLDLSKIEARQMELEDVSFNLSKVIREAHKLFGSKASQKGLQFDLEFGAGMRGHVRGDPTRVRQVLSNLLSNAVKFTEAGGISVDTSVEEDVLTMTVTDTGVGISDVGQDQLFQAFKQADTSITRKFGGTGLGLEISRQMCILMGGDLTYAPNKTRGSVFTATMHVTPSEKSETGQSTTEIGSDAILARRTWRVLAAEDNKTNRKVLELLLKRYNFDLRIVDDGAQLVKAFQADPADIILMDVNMPILCGLEAAARIRVYERAKRMQPVPIIALTANAMTHQVSDYLRRGMDAHVSKPIRREELADCMARLLDNHAE
ncbi:MAG: ATP-binding protein [Pelagimonas sp.]|uniref:ATP-binding protein n=1 Tax=Pelagimonas sp. TaxID=2073170 RepID=UPI003D6A536C